MSRRMRLGRLDGSTQELKKRIEGEDQQRLSNIEQPVGVYTGLI